MVGGEVIGSVLLSRPAPYSRGRGAADPRVGQPGGAGPGEPAQPGRRGDPRRDRRPDRAAQQARGHGRAEADVRAGRDDEGAARAAPARPRPLQAGQRPARACRGGPGPGERRRHAAQRAASPGFRRPQRRGGVRGPAARHRGRRGPRDRRADPGGDRRDLRARAPTCRSRPPSVSLASPATRARLERLERLADAALYVAKRQGRNRVEQAEPTSVGPARSCPGPVSRRARSAPGPSLQRARFLGPLERIRSGARALRPNPRSGRPTGRGRPACRPWSAGRWRRPSRRCLTGRRSSAPPS